LRDEARDIRDRKAAWSAPTNPMKGTSTTAHGSCAQRTASFLHGYQQAKLFQTQVCSPPGETRSGRELVTREDVRRRMSELNSFQRNKIRRLLADDGEGHETTGEVNIVPFLDIITNVLMFVLATVAVTFTATIDVTMPGERIRPSTAPVLDLTVLV